MKNMINRINRKTVYVMATLIAMDQGIKLIIFWRYMEIHFPLIPNILFFRPVQNKDLNYLGSLFETKTPLTVMILLEMIAMVALVMIYRYCLFISRKNHKLLVLFWPFGVAGISCSFIDSVLWGGSIDFIRIFNWFTFDLKDVYLNIMALLVILYMVFYVPEYYNLSKKDRRKQGLILWIKNGCPIKPIE